MYKPLQTGRLYEQIANQIEQNVLNGALAAGDRLPAERELATQFAVSRTVVREAVKALRQRGLIEVYPGRGTFVTNGTSQALQDSLGLAFMVGNENGLEGLLELREILEPAIAAKAAERATEKQVEKLEALVVKMDDVLTEVDEFVSADLDFHLTLAEASQNHLLPTIMRSIVDLLQKQRNQIFKADGGQSRTQLHHYLILEAIKERNPMSAQQAMRNHLRQVREDFESSVVG